MHISSNEISSQNYFINVGQTPLSYSNTAPHMWAINRAQHVHIIFNQTGTVANQDRASRSDTMLNFYISIGHLNKRVMHISSNEVSPQNQLAIGGVAHKLYIHTHTLKFYQCRTNPTFIFQHTPSRVGY